MTMQLRKAERKQSRLRIALAGPSGSGKTMGALLLARGLVGDWKEVALIDTENKRGDIYSDLGEYNIITLESPFSPERFIEAIHVCEQAGVKVIIIDSISHEWDGEGGCLDLNEHLANAKYKGNTWAAWNETTPRHRRFLEAIIQSHCHVITTMRSKTDTIQTEDKKIKKVGLKEIQREGYEYEMTVSFNVDRDTHLVIVGKDNTQLFTGDPFMLTEEHGKKLHEWVQSGKPDLEAENKARLAQLKKSVIVETRRLQYPDMMKQTAQYRARVKNETGLELIDENLPAILEKLKVIPTPPSGTPPAAGAIAPATVVATTAAPEDLGQSEFNDDASAPSNTHVDQSVDQETEKGAMAFDRALAPKASPAMVGLIKTLLWQKLNIVRSELEAQLSWVQINFEIKLDRLDDLMPDEAKAIVNYLNEVKSEAPATA